MTINMLRAITAAFALSTLTASAAENIAAPNRSFENPPADNEFGAVPFFEAWQKFSKAAYWDETQFGSWNNLSGVFRNSPEGQPGRITNMDGIQAAFLFGTPGNGIFQELPNTFEAGSTYTLTAGFVNSTFQPPAPGNQISMALYHRESETNLVVIAQRDIVFTAAGFPDPTRFTDHTLTAPATVGGSAWLDKPIGIMFFSSTPFETAGGVWDIDNVRLTREEGLFIRFALEGSNLRITWKSLAGAQYQVRVSDDLTAWADYETSVSGTGGDLSRLIPTTGDQRFFTVRAIAVP